MGIDRGQGTPVSSNPLELDNDDYSSTVVGPQGPKGDDGDITPEYTQMYNDTIAAKNTATSKASEASASASNASTSETNANTSANAASASATSASNSASASATSETNAATSESNAASSATAAASSATSASGSASTATTKASEAATSASTATTKASEAATSASTATTKASEAATSATNAASSESAASTSATNAATSATAAASSASNASTSETNAASSATSAATSATNAAASESSVATNASNAATSETNAANSATSAATSASSALTYKNAAESAKTAAETAETNAETAETNAASSATSAASSATSASSSASTATTKASEASTSASNAATSETNAATSETNAATSETNAASSASSASTSATSASTSASTATTKASEAATSASTATTKASEASTSASNAATSATNAATSATNAAASFDSFDDRYLGSKSSEPTVDNDGDALLTGALYFNSTTNTMKVYSGSAWLDAYATLSGALLTTGGTMTGDLDFNDNVKAKFGTGDDLQIYHDGSNSYINDTGTGLLQLRTNGSEVNITGQSGTEFMARFQQDGAVRLYYDNAQKLSTTSTGIDVTGNVSLGDNEKVTFGASDDLQIFHNGSHSYVQDNGTGHLFIQGQETIISGNTSGNWNAKFVDNGDSVFYHSTNGEKLKVTSTGIDVTGNVSLADNGKATFGASDDLQIYHDGSNSYIKDSGTGNLWLQGSTQVNIGGANGTIGVQVVEGANVTLRHNNSPKLATTSSGVDVTGKVTSDELAVEGTNGTFSVNSQGFIVGMSRASQNILRASDASGSLVFQAGGAINRQAINSNGDISFYEDTGTTPKLFWDASAESLMLNASTRIGTEILTVNGTVTTGGGTASSPALAFRADSSTGIFRPASQSVGVSTNGSERMRIDSSGALLLHPNNVGRGLKITTGTGNAVGSDTTYETIAAGYGQHIFKTDGSERLRIDSSGRVGIGTSSPSSYSASANNLVIRDTSGEGGITIVSTNTGASNIFFADTDATAQGQIKYQHSGDYMRFYTAASERMRIDASGRVGIGTTSPASTLEVKSNATNDFITLQHTSGPKSHIGNSSVGSLLLEADAGNTGANSRIEMKVDGSERMRIDSSGALLLNPNNATRGLKITTSQTTAVGDTTTYDTIGAGYGRHIFKTDGSERLRIDSSGNVGIGTSSPVSIGGHTGVLTLHGDNATALVLKDNVGRKDIRLDDGNLSVRNASGNTHLMVTDGGSVGIGTSSPSSILDLGSNTNTSQEITISGGRATFGYDVAKGASGAVVIQGSANKAIHFENTADTSAMVIDSSGNVGIGTSSPAERFHVFEQKHSSPLLIEIENDGYLSGASAGIKLTAKTTGGVSGSFQLENYQNNFRVLDDGSERMRIDSSGNVGIGTSSPASHLEIRGSSGGNDKQLRLSTGSTTYWDLGRSGVNGNFEITEDSGDTYFVIDKTSGNVGIGASSPAYPLEVSKAGTSGTGSIGLVPDADNGHYIRYGGSGTNNNVFRLLGTGSTERMRIDASGNVGIGTTSPTQKLDVSGTVKATAFVGDGSGLTGISGGGGDDGPAFMAHTHPTGTGPPQTLAHNTWTKTPFGHEVVDTDNCYDHSNSRFTPNVAGWYVLNVNVQLSGSTNTSWFSKIMKNGSTDVCSVQKQSAVADDAPLQMSAVVYFNGSTDYAEVYTMQTSGSSIYSVQIIFANTFNGALVRKQ